ncbi:DNA polymerase III subunit gamma and tau [Sinomonas atrocyanea]|uniref:DNA polymerase III subunit gamma and tau n=1 Tax=Sinomonas atrocyanea TaxID=37927 RepID=UPI00277ED575|nr:DNA polymerase III subunit gamma and tau [Sinomonas atrocyanea]MDQ0261555.1 DNA polymerase-3 subunit gamma/tau [Sinomonas atrocyanea]MDR6623255.1 DNA polymerase-3 subunit gamma/tau [Sinomonas atrocyanea]
MNAPAALYRRYRPDTFQDVIGQEHVTEPLMTALRKNRVNHAYLFSGPRGCGKTTSARILARCLNCEQGPTPEPCGVCPSCVELARGGAGSLDVIEIDAASHGGVDDARDLRERATFAPVRDRYKIFIIDEAHMVTSAGFNALLKIVEEPPEHIKFIFATTEPDKVIGTIRSRTHHYPFRLVPPEPLMAYLEQLCTAEHVPVAPGVLSLVVRAGGGSVRDSLSVLDQLMAGAGTGGIDYELAVALLGYTHAALLDDVVDAMAAGDSGTVFRAVDRVIQTGHDPRRFVEDLLERFRDLIIVQALPDAAESILRGIPADQLARMRVQAQNLGAAELSRAADVTNGAFNEMTGATSPRLHLELLCARLMLPAADATERGWAARVDRLERRLSFAHDDDRPASAAPAVDARSEPPVAERSEAESKPAPAPAIPVVERSEPPVVERSEAESKPAPAPAAPVAERSEPPVVERSEAESKPAPAPQPAPAAPEPGDRPAPEAQHGGAGSVEMFRRAWPDILDTLAKVKRSTWALVGPNASVAGFDGRTLALAFGTSGLASAFSRGDHSANLHTAITSVLGVDCQIDAVTGGNGPGAPAAGGGQRPKAPAEPRRGTPAPETAPRPEPSAQGAAEPAASSAPAEPADASSVGAAPSAADIAWGLAPEPQPAPSAQQAPPQTAPAPDSAPQAPRTPAAQGPRPAAATPQAGASPRDSAPGNPSRQDAAAGRPAAPAPRPAAASPYDDIPFSDEEPPGDWDEPYPEDDGRPAPRRPSQSPAPVSRPQAPAAPGAGAPAQEPRGPRHEAPAEAPKDPWAYARESTPGVWSIGTEPNTRSDDAPAGASPASSSAPGASSASGGAASLQPTGAPRQAPAATAVAAQPAYEPAAAQPPQRAPSGQPDAGRKLSMYERLSRKAAAEQAQAQPQQAPPREYVEDIASADDETIEHSALFGRAAVERILGGKLIEERGLDGTVIPPR